MEATLEESLKSVRILKEYYISQLPEGLSDNEKQGFIGRISEMFSGAEIHVLAIYDEKLFLGENLSALLDYCNNHTYRFHLEGINRHIEDGPIQIKQANILVKKTGREREMREYIAAIAPRGRRL